MSSQVQQIKDATNIVEVIGERLELQRAGGYHKANCPFHSEKSPSFFVSESMQRYKCFGCGESGDVITFLEKYEGMTFLEALEDLAQRAGITLEKFTKSAAGNAADEERKKILEILDLAREYYHFLLTEHAVGEKARLYAGDRNIKNESIQLFQLGYSTPEWDSLFTYLHKKKKYAPDLIEKAGLVIKGKKGGYYDRFRDRLMFPLRNNRGQVVGFSGRVLDPTIKEAKYINSPETTLYHKGSMLFGYAELLQHIRKSKSIIIVEGELDVLASTQAHVNNIAAVKGSALTQEHAKLIKRVADVVILSLDTDSAGIEATKRAIKTLTPMGLEVRVAQVPAGKDPDELVKQDPALWRDAVKKTLSVYAFLIEQAVRVHDATTGEGRRKVLEEVGPVLAEMSHAVEQDYYIKFLADTLKVREEVVREDVRRASQLGPDRYKRAKAAQEVSGQNNQDDGGESSSSETTSTQNLTRRARLERYLSFLFFQLFIPPHTRAQEKLLVSVLADLQSLKLLGWEEKRLGSLVERLVSLIESHSESPILLESLSKNLADDQAELVMQVAYQPKALVQLEHASLADEWESIVTQLRKVGVQNKISELTEQLKAFDAKDELSPEEEIKQQQLLREVMDLKKQTA